jgi:dolichol-phosphate mannosyltransferase
MSAWLDKINPLKESFNKIYIGHYHEQFMKLSVILPCFNEEQNVMLIENELINVLKGEVDDLEIVAVDDGSCDNTLNALLKLQVTYPFIKVISHGKNKGLGAAIQSGIQHSSNPYIVTLDTDMTFHPRLVKNLIRAYHLHNVDFIVGSPTLARFDSSVPRYRIFLSKCVNLLYRVTLGKKVTAITPIFRLFRSADLKKLHITSNGFDGNAEIMAKLILKGKKFVEIPAELTTRIYGESKLNNLKEAKNHVKLLSKILMWRFLK